MTGPGPQRPALELFGIRKRFGPVDALRGADFTLRPGEVHGLLGENGAGKSTLMHVAFGLVRPDAGVARVRGKDVRIRRPNDAKMLGIGMVHQHFTSIPTLTVAENLRLARGGAGRNVRAPSEEGSPVWGALLGDLDWGALVESLSVAQKQRLEILQALSTGASILLLDEPTAVLAPSEIAQLLGLLRSYADGGGSIVFITHKLDEVFAVADQVTVLRRGVVTLTGELSSQSRQSLAKAMIGDAPLARQGQAISHGVAVGPVLVRGPGLELRGGEIIGVAAVEGNGQKAFLRGLAGIEPLPKDTIVGGAVALLPEDRATEGLVPSFTLTENLVLGLGQDPRWVQGPWLRWRAAQARMRVILEEFNIRAAGPEAKARTLSGGNQQKLVFARAIEGGPAIVVAENPTRGLDLNATRFVHERLRLQAARGALVIVYSEDLDEVLEVATRVLVMFRGKIREAPAGAGREAVGGMMLGLGA